jgi:hypothetical protein
MTIRIVGPLLLLFVCATGAVPAPPVVPPPAPPRAHAHTAIGAVLWANNGRVPDTAAELRAALDKIGGFVQVSVPFSAVDLESGLSHPRVVIAAEASTHRARPKAPAVDPQPPQIALVQVAVAAAAPMTGGGGGSKWGGGGGKQPAAAPGAGTKAGPLVPVVVPPPAPPPAPPAPAARLLGDAPPNWPHLDGRLFLAVNTAPAPAGKLRARTVEFISWNSAALKFDFGVIEDMGTGSPRLTILDGVRCFTCHKNRGPIFGVSPWSNTVDEPGVRAAAHDALAFPFARDAKGVPLKITKTDELEGLLLARSQVVEVDAAARHGAELLHNRELAKLLSKSADGRKALVALLSGVVANRAIDSDRAVRNELNLLTLTDFLRDAHALNKAAPSGFLADFGPTAGRPPQVAVAYDAARRAGNHGLPAAHRPSNPRAFVRPVPVAPQRPSDVLSAAQVARAIGLSESDREFLAIMTAEKDLKDLFAAPAFADVLATGVLPDREDFKDRVIAALKLGSGSRARWAWGPKRDPNFVAARDARPVPTHACLACHDVKGQKAGGFGPIPPLAFDPLDASARAAWAKTAPPAKRAEVLAHLYKRVEQERDMPPEDSAEHEAYRGKTPAALAGLKEWLERELKGAK